jgi:hypothetical protein
MNYFQRLRKRIKRIEQPPNLDQSAEARAIAMEGFLFQIHRDDCFTPGWYRGVAVAAMAAGLPFWIDSKEILPGKSEWIAWALAGMQRFAIQVYVPSLEIRS